MKNLRTILYLSLIILIILLSNACNKKEPTPEYYTFRLGLAKDYLWANTGSYWIYKNTATGDLDTQTCIGISIDTFVKKGVFEDTKHITVDYEKLRRGISSSFNKWYESQNTNSFTADYGDPSHFSIALTRSATSICDCFYYPFDPNEWRGNTTSPHYIGMDTTFILQGKIYNNVVKFELGRDPIEDEKLGYGYSNNIYYWARGVGLIKKEMKTYNSSWELIEYNIIP